MPDIECRIAESMVTQYINHSLSVDELEEFLNHVSHCSSCYDELETYFIVHEAMQQLNEDSGESVLDFRDLLKQDIRKSRRYICKKKLYRFCIGAMICLLIVALAAFLVYVMMQTVHVL